MKTASMVLALAFGNGMLAQQAGDLDSTFGVNGIVITDFGIGDGSAFSVAIQSDDKIVLAGSWNNGTEYDFVLVRYNTDGSLDTSFGTDGIVTTDFDGSGEGAYSVAVQTDEKIVVAGVSYKGTNDFALARYNADGILDTGFGAGGKLTTDFDSSGDWAKSLAIQQDGKIVVAGYSYKDTVMSFALARFGLNGSLDTSFSGDGKLYNHGLWSYRQ